MLSLEVLPAFYGDCILITYGRPSSPRRIVIDGGFSSTGAALADRINAFDRPIDLLVVTHVDNDHISGVLELLENAGSKIEQVWFNGYKHLDQFSDILGPVSGEKLTKTLRDLEMPWNVDWDWSRTSDAPSEVGGPVVVDGEPVRIRLPVDAQAIVLSPTPEKLADLLPVWKEAVRAAGLEPGTPDEPEAEERPSDILGGSLEALADKDTGVDDSEANGSSIGFVFQYYDREQRRTYRILLAGDAHPDVLETGLSRLAGGGKYSVDACKLPHHTSKKNVTRDLVKALDCPRWIVSTNGKRFSHPNPEALARIVLDGGDDPEIICNYASNEQVAAFAVDFPPADSGYELTQPLAGGEGIVIDFTGER